MPIEYIAGDLFANVRGVRAFAHGCNCQGGMGAGIAVEFKNRWPAMFKEYVKLCKSQPRQFNPGDAFLWKCEGQPWVFNLATQEHYKWFDPEVPPASYEAIEASMGRMRSIADAERIESIGMPRIGAGLGGLEWGKVRAIIDRVFGNWTGTLIVYEDFKPERPVAV